MSTLGSGTVVCVDSVVFMGGGGCRIKKKTLHAYCAHAVRVKDLGNILHPPPPIQYLDSGQ